MPILAWSVAVQAQISLTGQYIPRPELRHGYKSLASSSQDPAFFVSQRTRLVFTYATSKYKFGVSAQDIRTWGSQSQLNKSDNLLSMHEAWGQVFFKNNLSLKIGRQELVYDDHRIFGNVDWTMQGRSHDLVLFKYAGKKLQLDVGAAYNQDKEQLDNNIYTVANNYKTLQFLWIHKKFSENLNLSLLFLNNGVQTSSSGPGGVTEYQTSFSQTSGARLIYGKGRWNFNSSFYFQTGEDGTGKNLSATNFAANLAYNGIKKLTFIGGVELLSGTSQTDPSEDKNRSFNPLYGTNHKFNGFMDYFYVGNHLNTVGLQDISFRTLYKSGKHRMGAQLHFFSSAANIIDSTEYQSSGSIVAKDNYLGTEIDLNYVYVASKQIQLIFGYSQMFGTSSMVEIKGGDKDASSYWSYIMLKLTPVFVKKEKKKKDD